MASIFRGQGSAIGRSFALLPALLFAVVTTPSAMAQLSEQPMLVVDPGMHTAPITDVAVDAAGRFAVTGSHDKTVRVWSLTDGKLLQTIRMPAGSDNIGKIYAVAISPDGALVAAGGWTWGSTNVTGHPIYLFETRTGKMTARMGDLPEVTLSLAFSSDGRYLAAGVGGGRGLRVYDRDRQWTEAFRDTGYDDDIYGLTFGLDGRLATTSNNKVRLYDRDFKLVVPPRTVTGQIIKIAFSPDGTTLAVGYENAATVDLFDGHSLAPLPRPNVKRLRHRNLGNVTWSKDGKTLYAGGAGHTVLAWTNAERRALPAGNNTVSGLAGLPDGGLLVAAQDPFLAVLDPDGRPRWAHASPKVDFRGHYDKLAVSADGTIVDFGFEQGKSPLRIDLRALNLSHDPPPITIRCGQSKPDLLSKDGVVSSRRSMANQSSLSGTSNHEAWPSIQTVDDSCLDRNGT